MDRGAVQPLLGASDLAVRLEGVYATYSTDTDAQGGSGAFMSELLEAYDVDALSPDIRRTSAPALWLCSRPFSLDHFTTQLTLQAAAATTELGRHTVLSTFLAEEPQMRGLQHLPAALRWLRLLMARFNRRLDRGAARETTVANVLKDLPAAERPTWEAAFEGFAAAWNSTWQFVGRFGCLRIPADFVSMSMTRDTPISFSLPCEKDEGICSLALVRFMVDKHNAVVQGADELQLLRGRSRRAAPQPVVSSRFLSAAHTLRYNLHGEFLPFLEKHCCGVAELGGDGRAVYDFKHAEQMLLDRYFAMKPVVDVEMRMFEFANEQRQAGGTASLKQKVPQEPLPRDLQRSILADLASPSNAQACLEVLDTAISFLQATGGSVVQTLDASVGSMLLAQYLSTVLLLDPAALRSRVVVAGVRLRHVDALWTLLHDFTSCDPFANLSPIYCEELSDEDKSALTVAVQNGGDGGEGAAGLSLAAHIAELLPLLKDFMIAQLSEEHIGKNLPVTAIVGHLELDDAYLMDLPWWKNFPEELRMKNMQAIYNVLEAMQ